MSKKTSPQSRPSPTRRSRRPSASRGPATARPRTARRGAGQEPGSTANSESTPERPTTLQGRLRRFAPVIVLPDAIIALCIVILAFAGLLLSGESLALLPVTIGEMWMITVLAPVIIDGVTVSYLPLLPAVGLMALVAHRIHRAVRKKVSMVDLGVLAACVLVLPLIFTVIAWFMVWDASRVYPVEAPPMLTALGTTMGVHLIALVVGMGQRLWEAIAKNYSLPVAPLAGVQLANRFFLGMLGLAALLLVALAIAQWDQCEEMIAAYPSISTWGILGLIVLSLLYLPNALVAAVAVLLGSEFHLGPASVSLFSIHLVPLPPMPLTALIPASAAEWAPLLLLLTAALVSWVMVKARPSFGEAIGAALGGALSGLIGAWLAHGTLGGYGATGPMIAMTAGLAAAWLGLVGVATAAVLWFSNQRNQEAPVDEPEEDQDIPEDEVDTEPSASTDAPAAEEQELDSEQ